MARGHLGAVVGRLGSVVPLAACLLAGLAAAQGPQQSSTGPAAGRDLTVANRGTRTIEQLFVTAESDPAQGPDRLGNRHLEPGASVHIRLGRQHECVFRVQAVYERAGGRESRTVDLCRSRRVAFDGGAGATAPPAASATAPAPTTAPVPAAVPPAARPAAARTVAAVPLPAAPVASPAVDEDAMHDVALVNRSPRPIRQIYLSSLDVLQWGGDRLGEQGIAPDERRLLTWHGDCHVNLRIVFDNRSAEERRDIDLCAVPAVAIHPGWTTADTLPTPKPPPADVTVVNNSGLVISELSLMAEGSDGPGRDLLGSAELKAGAQAQIRLGSGETCRYRARVQFSGRERASDVPGFDVCETPRIEIPPPLTP